MEHFLLEKYERWIEYLNSKNDEKQEVLNSKNFKLTQIDDIVSKLQTISEKYTEIKTEVETNNLYEENNIKIEDVITLSINQQKLTELKTTVTKDISNVKESKIITEDKTIPNLNSKIQEIKLRLDEAEVEYQNYIEQHQIWKRECANLTGNENTSNTIKYFEKEIENIETKYPKELQEAISKRLVSRQF